MKRSCALLLIMIVIAAGASDSSEPHLHQRHNKGATTATPPADDQNLSRPVHVLARSMVMRNTWRVANALVRAIKGSVSLVVEAVRNGLSAFRMREWQQRLLSCPQHPQLVWRASSVGDVERCNVSDPDVERGLGPGQDRNEALASEEVCVRAVVCAQPA